MMFFKQYDLIITTVAPVFIGSGKQYGTRDYIYTNNDNKEICYFFDQEKLFRLIDELGLIEEYEQYMLDNKQHENQPIGEWLEAKIAGESVATTKSKPLTGAISGSNLEALQKLKEDMIGSNSANNNKLFQDKAQEAGYETIRTKLSNLELGGYNLSYSGEDRPKAIEEFIKDGRDRYYLPGSSIKGALRTQIERLRQIDDKESFSFFNKLSIADSDVISDKHFFVLEKLGKVQNGRRGIATYRESLLPEVEVQFRVTTKSEEMDKLFRQVVTQGALYIGGGAGFVEKSLNPNEAKRKIFGNNAPAEITPRVIKLNGKRYEMGKCRIAVVPIV